MSGLRGAAPLTDGVRYPELEAVFTGAASGAVWRWTNGGAAAQLVSAAAPSKNPRRESLLNASSICLLDGSKLLGCGLFSIMRNLDELFFIKWHLPIYCHAWIFNADQKVRDLLSSKLNY